MRINAKSRPMAAGLSQRLGIDCELSISSGGSELAAARLWASAPVRSRRRSSLPMARLCAGTGEESLNLFGRVERRFGGFGGVDLRGLGFDQGDDVVDHLAVLDV